MLLIDPAAGAGGLVVDFNPAALNLFKPNVNELTDLTLPDLYAGDQPEGQTSAMAATEYSECAARGESPRFRARFVRSDQTTFDADVTLSRIGTSENDPQLAVIREVSSVPAAGQLDSVTAELDAFTYAISHDLRAAILGIASCSRIVVEDFGQDIDGEAKRWLNHIHDDAVELDKLTEALVDLSRVSRKIMDPIELDLTSMAREIIHGLQVKEGERPIDVLVSEDLTAHGDFDLMRAMLQNLLENAWKFTRKSANARIEFGAFPIGQMGNPVFYVRDNGPGFDMAHVERLFVPFQRLHSGPDFEGNGIGLATVRRIVHRHGGKVWAEGAPAAGATFFFTLNCGVA